MESCCAIPPPSSPLPPPLLYSAPQPLMVGLNPTLATTVLISLQFLFSSFSLKSGRIKTLPAFCMDAFEFEHVIICIVKTIRSQSFYF